MLMICCSVHCKHHLINVSSSVANQEITHSLYHQAFLPFLFSQEKCGNAHFMVCTIAFAFKKKTNSDIH
jgi:hypothetical protein